jgi:hypothetical protein
MISTVPTVSSVHVELDERLSSTTGRTDETTKTSSRKYGIHYLFRLIFIERRCTLKIKSSERQIILFRFISRIIFTLFF